MSTKNLTWVDTAFGHELNGKKVRFEIGAIVEGVLRPVRGTGEFEVRTREEEDKKKLLAVVVKENFYDETIFYLSQHDVNHIRPATDEKGFDYTILALP